MMQMKPMKYLGGLAIALLLTACGGGSPEGIQNGIPPSVPKVPTMIVSIVDVTGLPVNTIETDGIYSVKAKLMDAEGKPVGGKLVKFNIQGSSPPVALLTPNSEVTDPNGVATVSISPQAASSRGAATVVASADLADGSSSSSPNPQSVSGSFDFTIQANILVPSDVVFELDKTTIANTGTDAAMLTVSVLDANRNVMSGIPVQVSLSPDGIFQNASGSATDDKGQFSGMITIGGTKTNRDITATIRVTTLNTGTLIRTATVRVTGSQIELTPVPATPTPSELVSLNVAARDSAGAFIPNVKLTLGGTAPVAGTVTTDLSGNALISFVAPNSPGNYSVIATGLGISTTKMIEVVGGVVSKPVAVGVVSASTLGANPTTIQPNTMGSTINRSRLSAKFQTADNKGIENMRVRFYIISPPLGNGELISSSPTVVYTNAAGVAETDYIAGTRSSPTNGVKVRACYSLQDFIPPNNNPNNCTTYVDATLTVAGAPLSISISDNNLLQKGLGNIAYIKQFLIQVNDAAGVAVKDAIVSASVDITHYGKGAEWGSPYLGIAIPSARDIHPDYLPSPKPNGALESLQNSTLVPPVNQNIWCLNEDWNRNGFLDTGSGEDINGNGSIQPQKAEVIVSYVNGNKTDANGQLLVQVSYGQNMGEWLAYTLRATTGVAGSEGDAAKSYVTDVLQSDVANGSFRTPPFGSSSCRTPG